MTTKLATVDGGKGDKDKDEYAELRQRVKDNRARVEDGYWELSLALREVYDNSAYVAWGYDSWKEYVEGEEVDFQLRKAQYLISIAGWFGKLPKNVQKWISAMGWTRAKELVGHVTAENAAEWKKKVAGKTTVQLQELLKASEGGGEGGEGGESGTSGDGDKASRWAFQLFPPQRQNVEAALAKASEVSKSDKEGHNLDLICSDFLANSGAIQDANSYLEQVGKLLGVRLVAYQESTQSVVFGEETLDELISSGDDDDDDGAAAAG